MHQRNEVALAAVFLRKGDGILNKAEVVSGIVLDCMSDDTFDGLHGYLHMGRFFSVPQTDFV